MRERSLLLLLLLISFEHCYSWGFYAHRRINTLAVFLLPPGMLGFYKKHIEFLGVHAVDPDKRRYAVPQEGPRHFIDMDRYGPYPYKGLPRNWDAALQQYNADTLQRHGILPWWVQTMQQRLTHAFRQKDADRILKYSAEIGHYLGDAHVPLHTSSNYNGQFTGQRGIHGFWETRIPELLSEEQWDFFMEPASYIKDPGGFIWKKVLESAQASDSVLRFERELSRQFTPALLYAIEERNGQMVKTYSASYSRAYDKLLQGMVERRMRSSVHTVASFWYTAWVNAGQPDLDEASSTNLSPLEKQLTELLEKAWRAHTVKGRDCE